MKLGRLVSGADMAFADITVTGFAIDHRKIAPGTVFGAFEGATFNGEDFIDDAIAAGAKGNRYENSGRILNTSSALKIKRSARKNTFILK